ncbi:hypothetical protein GDO81_027069 [Engystomops pustulosus]|uniref:Secreted protein n=1 Tax=Engystomops pustulosus TaxID=76066 RepID=A0AAV6YQ17_ENGPU|nr:hypothetical protein GDO81_027069 [Engystomops pustulosus]
MSVNIYVFICMPFRFALILTSFAPFDEFGKKRIKTKIKTKNGERTNASPIKILPRPSQIHSEKYIYI